jgi:hypothetical protein
MKPVENWQMMNFDDMTSYYTCAGIARGQTDHEWRIVSSSAVTNDVRKIRSATRQEDESKFNGITVKWCAAAAASGQIFPMVAIFCGFSESMMPDDSMIVLKIPGMCFGGRIDVFSSSFGYVVLMRSGTSMVEFHQWYQQEIITATFRANRLRYLPFSDPDPTSNVPDDEKGVVWFDSDNTNVKTTTNMNG